MHSVTVALALDHLRGGPKSGRIQCRYSLQKPVFDRLFCVPVLALFSSIDLLQKRAANFLGTSDIIRQDWVRSRARRVPVLDLENVCLPASSSKNRSLHKVSDSLNNPIKEHLRRTHSFALAQSCAFGAIMYKHFLQIFHRALNFGPPKIASATA